MYLPKTVPKNQQDSTVPLKKILLWNGINSWGSARPGRGVFLKEKCPVSTCAVVTQRSEAPHADIVLFKDHFTQPTYKRPIKQLWMLYMLECPLHTQMFKVHAKGAFNWTATYRSDSTIVAPYERWQYYNENVR
jgi:glycoprotein 3-alpha-L-fucosyltransferase